MKCFVTILRVSLAWSRTSRPVVCQPLSRHSVPLGTVCRSAQLRRHQRQSQHWYIRSKFGQVLLTTGGALVAAVSLKFNLIGKKEELNAAICELERIKKSRLCGIVQWRFH